MAPGWGGLVWKVQFVVFGVVALDAGRRLATGGRPLDSLAGVASLLLLALSVAGAAYVVRTRQPISRLFAPSDGSGDDRGR